MHLREFVPGLLWAAAAVTQACSGGAPRAEIASLQLTCAPSASVVRCELLALSQDVSRPPANVTGLATWRLSGVFGAAISPGGIVTAPMEGLVEIDAEFDGHRAWTRALLEHNPLHEAQCLNVQTPHIECQDSQC